MAGGDHAQRTAEKLMDLIGWKYSVKETKRLELSKEFVALGVEFDLSQSIEGVIKVKNKVSRIEQIVADIDKHLAEGALSEGEAAAMRGRLQFAESQTFGRAVGLRMKTVNARACGSLSGKHISARMQEELIWAKKFLLTSVPRTLRCWMSDRRLVIFTDAALEENDTFASIGMVALWIEGSTVVAKYFFSEVLPPDILNAMQKSTSKIISSLELMAAVLAVQVLSLQHHTGRSFLYVDNEAARACLISQNSSVESHKLLLQHLSDILCGSSLFLWVSRVPSASNPADEPSRLQFRKLLTDGHRQVLIPWNQYRKIFGIAREGD